MSASGKTPDAASMICMAEIIGVHGIKGVLKLKIFSEDPDNLIDYSPLSDATGQKTFEIVSLHPHGNIHLAVINDIQDRTAAEKMRGTKLYISRDRLPEITEEDRYYYTDLLGLTVKTPEGEVLGKIAQVANYGAGDLLEIKPVKGASYFVPFTQATVPHVSLESGEVTVIIPLGLLD